MGLQPTDIHLIYPAHSRQEPQYTMYVSTSSAWHHITNNFMAVCPYTYFTHTSTTLHIFPQSVLFAPSAPITPLNISSRLARSLNFTYWLPLNCTALITLHSLHSPAHSPITPRTPLDLLHTSLTRRSYTHLPSLNFTALCWLAVP